MNIKNKRLISVAVCSFLFAYLLTFVFEGKVLYSLLDYFEANNSTYVIAAIMAHFIGLVTCGFAVKSQKMAKSSLRLGILVCLIATIPFFFTPSALWLVSLIVTGFSSGWAFASWSWFLKSCTPKDCRIKSCADVLIVSNVIMIGINVVAVNCSAFVGLALSMLSLATGLIIAHWLPMEEDSTPTNENNNRLSLNLRKPLFLLFVFIAVITINSGLMYQVINPAFLHLSSLTSWYWAVPYILALLVMRNLPAKAKRSRILYAGMVMIMSTFACFMLMGRGNLDYLVIDTLMLGACGIFDLFWWSIIGEMLEYSNNPVKVSGIGLSANVFGVLCGDLLGIWMASVSLPEAQITVIALCVVCVTLVLLPPLNNQLVLLLKSHTYLSVYSSLSQTKQTEILQTVKALDPLTSRESEVLEQLMLGKTNKEMAATLGISENTVKTHVRNIYSKYDVSSRAELISTLLKNQANP